ncbi:MAG: DJ-1/PfpI family protein [Candidatus Omnitrophota bacterium]
MKKILSIIIAFIVPVVFYLNLSYAQGTKKAVFIIAQENFQDDEFAKPLEALKARGISVTVASTKLQEATGTGGMKAKPDMLLKDVAAEDFDAIVFIGGPGAAQYLDDPVAHKLAQDGVAQNKIVGGICLAPVILTNAGILKGKKATVYPSEADKLKSAGVDYTAQPVEKDGKIITADGPGSAGDFGEALAYALEGGN